MPPRIAWLAVPLAVLIACSSDRARDGGDAPTPIDPVAGRYAITSHFDLSDAEGTPARVSDAIAALTGLADDPAGTLFDLIRAADIPVLDQLLGAIPGIVVDKVGGWIDDYLIERVYQGVPLAELLAGIADDLATAMSDFEVMSDLDLGPADGGGLAVADHGLTAIAFQLDGARHEVDTPAVVDQLTMARDVTCEISLSAGVDDATDPVGSSIDIGDHAFTMPLGDYLVAALDQAIAARFGVANLRAALGLIVDCAAMADAVASRCIGFVCVGHGDQIEAVCDAGLDQVAGQVEDRIAAIDYAAVHLVAGQATLEDQGELADPADGRIDRLEAGRWQVGLDLDGHELPTSATFVGRRAAP